MAKFVERKSCPKCNRMVAFKTDGNPYKHTCQGDLNLRCDGCGKAFIPRNGEMPDHDCAPMSDPAPTVEAPDAEESSMEETAPGFVAGPPAPAEVSHWQQQAREAAQRHVEILMSGEPNGEAAQDAVDRLKERAAEALAPMTLDPRAVTYPGMDPAVMPTRLPTAEQFLDPAAETDELNVSGQPKARYEWRGEQNLGYLVRDPETGDFRRYKNGNPKGWTRATTFNKAASSTVSLTDWKLRNVILGASRRPDLLLRAHGKTHADRRELNALAAELEAVAGAKVGADIGTFLHAFTELMDAGLKTWRDAPAQYRQQLKLYAESLAAAGFEPVPGLIERTTAIREFGGVVGTFDRILYHRPSGQYVIGDLKTGKTMDYARDETFCQEWIYAHGVNTHGVYDWNTDTWRPVSHDAGVPNSMPPLVHVREDIGLIIHMPVQGDDAGSVFLEEADLVKGREYAQLCHDVRSNVKPKRKLWTWEPPEPEAVTEPVRERNWHAEFKAVTSREQANALYAELKAYGANEEYLTLARFFGKEALAGLATQPEAG